MNTRGGKRIKITVEEISYPHCNGSKGKAIPSIKVFDSGFKRPTRAAGSLMEFLGDKGYVFSWVWFLEYINKGKD